MNFDENSLYNISTSLVGKRYSLFDLASWKNGLAFRKINFSDTGIPVIKIAELNNGIGGTTAYTSHRFSDDVHIVKGDFLFSWSGNPQTSIDIFRFQLDEGWLNQHIFKVIPNENIVDKDYFFFLMKYLKPHFTQIATNKQTTGLGHVTIADIKRMSVILPELKIQRTIVGLLKPVDDKIELNNEINKNLEQQAQALFEQRFGHYKVSLHTEELQKPLNGLHYRTLASVCTHIKPGTNYQPQRVDVGVPFLNVKCINNGYIDTSDAKLISIEDYHKVHKNWFPEENDLLISRIGTLGLVAVIKDIDLPIAVYNEPINSDKKIVDSKLDFTYDFNHERRPTYGKETTHTGGESPTRA